MHIYCRNNYHMLRALSNNIEQYTMIKYSPFCLLFSLLPYFLLELHSVSRYIPGKFMWIKNSVNQRDRPLRNADDFMLPHPRTELFRKSPLYSLPLEWNKMDENKFNSNRTTFKTAVKYKLLNEILDGIAAGGNGELPLI